MRIPIEFDDETVVLIDEIAEISGLSRTEVVETFSGKHSHKTGS